MGYTTEFDGSVSISPPLNAHEIAYLRKFAASRRMDRARGPYFVDGSGPFGQGHDDDIRDFNKKFYNSEARMSYLIDLFLKPGAKTTMTDGGSS